MYCHDMGATCLTILGASKRYVYAPSMLSCGEKGYLWPEMRCTWGSYPLHVSLQDSEIKAQGLTSCAGTPKLGSAILACIAERVDAPVELGDRWKTEVLGEEWIRLCR